MTFTLPSSARPHLYAGSTFFTLERGVTAYSALRTGDTVTGACGEAKVETSVDSLQIGPLGQFFQQGVLHASCVGRAFDVRSIADAIEDESDPKALDPREIYTAVYLRLVSIDDPAIPVPQMPGVQVA